MREREREREREKKNRAMLFAGMGRGSDPKLTTIKLAIKIGRCARFGGVCYEAITR